MNQCPPGPQVFHWNHFEFFRKFVEIFANYCLSPVSMKSVINCSAGSTTPAKMLLPVSLTPANNLCHGFSVSTTPANNLSPVTTTPAINLLSVTRTGTPWRWGAAKDRRKLKGINWRSLRPLKSATAADGVIGTSMKSCIQKHPTHLDERPLKPPKLNNAILV
jgi:hypothetical protein